MKVGAIPIYRGRDGLNLCLVSTSASRRRFTFPKGALKRREAWEKGALRELREEAGVAGRVLMPRHPLVLASTKRPSESVVLYWCEVLSVDDKWSEDGMRRRMFCAADRLPKARLGKTGRKVFGEVLKLNLGDEAHAGDVEVGIVGRIRAQLFGLRLRADIDALTRP